MSRQVPVNVEVIDQFPAWQIDGFDKVSGLSAGDFAVTIYCDGVVQTAYPYAIAEIGTTGEYRLTFTPVATAFWAVEIQYERQDWFEGYEVATWSLDMIGDNLAVVKALLHHNAVLDQQVFGHEYRGRKFLTAARLRAYDTKLHAEAAGVVGLLYTFAIHAEYVDDEQTLYRLVRIS